MLFKKFSPSSRVDVVSKHFLSSDLVAPLFSRAEPFVQFGLSASWGTILWNYFVFGPVVQVKMSFKYIYYLELWWSLCSIEQNHLCNFGRRHHEEQFCDIILNFDQWFKKKCHLKVFLIWRSGSPLFQRSRTISAILKEDIMGNIHVKLYEIWMLFKENVYGQWKHDGQTHDWQSKKADNNCSPWDICYGELKCITKLIDKTLKLQKCIKVVLYFLMKCDKNVFSLFSFLSLFYIKMFRVGQKIGRVGKNETKHFLPEQTCLSLSKCLNLHLNLLVNSLV